MLMHDMLINQLTAFFFLELWKMHVIRFCDEVIMFVYFILFWLVLAGFVCLFVFIVWERE
jgi:hypothetical protein